jgi:hypothetical protein
MTTERARRSIALELERKAAAVSAKKSARPRPAGEALAMLIRRGFHPLETRLDLPFPLDLDAKTSEALAGLLDHYAFRLFFRGAILNRRFAPAALTRYLTESQVRALAEKLVTLDLAKRLPSDEYTLAYAARSFGGTLEWYIARRLRERFGFDVAVGLKLKGRGVGGDLDIVAAAEGKLIYLELKSSPPKYITGAEVAAFFDRVQSLRPDVALFVIDTALRLADKIIPMLEQELSNRKADHPVMVRRVKRELWAVSPHLFAVNARPDLMDNIGFAVAEGLRALTPYPY